ncbi:hypothetical protein BDF22DRAFT_439040 [Syncephalis plumigaleata]|nr:hypothetical protein BDF22DRAFT_439040 [Syncephalis plumigaleata]
MAHCQRATIAFNYYYSDDGKWSMLVEATTTTTAAAATVVYHEFYQSSIVSSEDESIQPIDLCYHRWIQHQLDEYSNGHITNDIDDRPGHAHLASLSVRDHALWLAEQLWYRNLPSLDTMEATPYQAMLIAYGIGLQCISRLSTEKQRSHITEYPSGEVFRLVQQWSQSLTSCHNDEELHKQAKLAQAYLNIAQSSQENDLIKNLSSIRSIDVERFQQDAAYAEEILIDIAKNELDFSLITLDTLGQRRGVDEISILKARLDGLFSAQNSFDVFLRQVSLIKDMIRTKASLFQRHYYPSIPR